jgi:ribosomal protein S8
MEFPNGYVTDFSISRTSSRQSILWRTLQMHANSSRVLEPRLHHRCRL